jgi:phospholipase/carboxylesterase
MSHDIVIQKPEGQAKQLFLLLHGVGASPRDMMPLGEQLAQHYPEAFIVSVAAAFPSDLGPNGYQWFSVQGITEDNRITRVANAMPRFESVIAQWQMASGVEPDGTALIGFSQGAIMALESVRVGSSRVGRVAAIAGRFATLPHAVPEHTTLHLLHGKQDQVIPYRHTVEAAHHLVALGADITADVIPFARHEVSDEIAQLLLERLQGHIPQRRWDEAVSAAPDIRAR